MEWTEGRDIEALLRVAGTGSRELIGTATRAVVSRLGERGSCILVADGARVVLSTEFPALFDLPLDLRRYPEITAAVECKEVIAIEDVTASPLLEPVANLLPPFLGAVVVVPLVSSDRCLGVIVAQSRNRRSMDAADLASVRVYGRLVATLLELQFGDRLADQLGCGRGVPLVPAPELAGVPVAVTPVSRGATALTRRRVLIADDAVDDALSLAELLQEEGFVVTCAADGADALIQARRNPPDVMVLDVSMPVMDGFAVAKELGEDDRTAAIPVLFLSGCDDLLSRVRELDRDGVDFLSKPFSFLELLARVEKSLKQAESKKHLRLDANIDELTGLGNLRRLREHFETEQARLGRYGGSLAIVMIDVDKLKPINDRYGHVVGSRILKAIGETLRAEVRATDLAVRYGGDEFVVLLSHTTLQEASAFATRVLSRVNRLRPEGVDITLSVGVAAVDRVDCVSVDAILAQADAAAYRAKHLGGNHVCTHETPPTLETAPPDEIASNP